MWSNVVTCMTTTSVHTITYLFIGCCLSRKGFIVILNSSHTLIPFTQFNFTPKADVGLRSANLSIVKYRLSVLQQVSIKVFTKKMWSGGWGRGSTCIKTTVAMKTFFKTYFPVYCMKGILQYSTSPSYFKHGVFIPLRLNTFSVMHCRPRYTNPILLCIHSNWFNSESTKAGRPSYHSL